MAKPKRFNMPVVVSKQRDGRFKVCVRMRKIGRSEKQARGDRFDAVCASASSPRKALAYVLAEQAKQLGRRKGHRRYGGR